MKARERKFAPDGSSPPPGAERLATAAQETPGTKKSARSARSAVDVVTGAVRAITGRVKAAVAATTTGIQRAINRNADTVWKRLPSLLREVDRGLNEDEIDDLAAKLAWDLVRKQETDPWCLQNPGALRALASKMARRHNSEKKRELERRGGRQYQYASERADSQRKRESPDAALAREELQNVITGCLTKMPTKRRTAFQLVCEDDLSYKEAAQRMGQTPAALHTHVSRAIRDLQRDVSDYNAYNDGATSNAVSKWLRSVRLALARGKGRKSGADALRIVTAGSALVNRPDNGRHK